MLRGVLAAVLLSSGSVLADEIELAGEEMTRNGETGVSVCEGNARLRSVEAAAWADRITWEERGQVATISGQVRVRLASQGLLLVRGDAVRIQFDQGRVVDVIAVDAVAYRKAGVAPAVFLAGPDTENSGKSTTAFNAQRVTRTPEGGWEIEGVAITPCDCDLDQPSWSLTAGRATLNHDADRVSAWSPLFRILDVPVLWFPYLSVPLESRQTGLLVPKPSFSGLSGASIEAPVFITLGESADLTLTPGYFFGARGVYGVRGPRLLTEFRYTPSTRESGRITLGALYDLNPVRDAIDPNRTYPGSTRGGRLEASLQHRHDLGDGNFLRIDGSVVSDGYLVRDVTADVLAREAGYLRSTAVLTHHGEDFVLGADLTLRQDLSTGHRLYGRDLSTALGPNFGPNPMQRFPALSLSWLETPIAGPVTVALDAQLARLAPLRGLSGDEGSAAGEGRSDVELAGAWVHLSPECQRERLSWAALPSQPACPGELNLLATKATQGDGRYQPGERTAKDRVDLFPRVRVAGVLGDTLALEAGAGFREQVSISEVTGTVAHWGYPRLSAGASVEVAREFGEDGELRHAISPRVHVVSVPVTVGTAPSTFDEIDASMSATPPRLQGVVELRQRITRRSGSSVEELFRLDLGQGAEWTQTGAGRLSESWARFGVAIAPATLTVTARANLPAARLTQVGARVSLLDPEGRGLFAGYEYVIDDGTERSRTPIDLLFPTAEGTPGRGKAQLLTAGARYRLGMWSLRYDVLFSERDFSAAPAGATQRALALSQHTLGIGVSPACDCFRVEAYATQRLADDAVLAVATYRVPDVGLSLTIQNFGTFAAGR